VMGAAVLEDFGADLRIPTQDSDAARTVGK
jgi:hypothetical protein